MTVFYARNECGRIEVDIVSDILMSRPWHTFSIFILQNKNQHEHYKLYILSASKWPAECLSPVAEFDCFPSPCGMSHLSRHSTGICRSDHAQSTSRSRLGSSKSHDK
jgi:hypothetical protein